MDKKRILEILEGAKDDNGEIPMSLVRKAFEKIEEPCEDAVSRQAVINIINKPVIIKAKEQIEALPSVQPKSQPTCNNLATDTISRQAAIDAIKTSRYLVDAMEKIIRLPSAQSEEVTPHRNYKYLSDYWCECGNHLGKKGSVTFCSDCGRKVKWDE